MSIINTSFPGKNRARYHSFLKVLLSIALLVWLFTEKASGGLTFEYMSEAKIIPFILSCLVLFLNFYIVTIRLQEFGGHKVFNNITRSELYISLLKGTFLNSVLPSGAGEAYRVRFLVKNNISIKKSAQLIIVDRLWGVTFLIFASSIVALSVFNNQILNKILSSINLGKPFLFLLTILCAVIMGVMLKVTERCRFHNIRNILGTSILSFFLWISSVALIAESLSIQIPYYHLLYAIPWASLSTMLPITVAGLGLREVIYSELFSFFGVETEKSVSMGLLQHLTFSFVLIPIFTRCLYLKYLKRA